MHVMAGLVPAIHVLLVIAKQDVNARDKRGMTTYGPGGRGVAARRTRPRAGGRCFALRSDERPI